MAIINDLLKEASFEILSAEVEKFKIIHKGMGLSITSETIDIEYEAYYNIAYMINPESVLEIGVYKGMSACAIMLGSHRLKEYIGIDNESYIENSNDIARRLINSFKNLHSSKFPHLDNILWSIFNLDTMPEGQTNSPVFQRTYDWIHIDGAHGESQAKKDILRFWPVTLKFMTIHDYNYVDFPHVAKDIDEVIGRNLISDIDSYSVTKSLRNFMIIKKKQGDSK